MKVILSQYMRVVVRGKKKPRRGAEISAVCFLVTPKLRGRTNRKAKKLQRQIARYKRYLKDSDSCLHECDRCGRKMFKVLFAKENKKLCFQCFLETIKEEEKNGNNRI